MESRFLDTLRDRVLVLDGAMGTSIHAMHLPLDDYNGLENCSEVLVLTRPDAIRRIHESFLAVGCDAVETNTFGGSRITLAEFGLEEQTVEINRKAAELARQACDAHRTSDRPRFVIGSIGPGTKLVSLGQVAWDRMLASYHDQVRGLLDGGVDALIVETCQDILQAKCAVVAARDMMAERGREVPIICSFTIETTGTMLIGTEAAAAVTALEAFDAVHAIGLNCATGPAEMAEHVRVVSDMTTRMIAVQPNAGLPQVVDGATRYMLTPDELARWLVEFIETDGVNIVGGCCGTTPEHLAKVVEAVGTRRPKPRGSQYEPSISSIYQAVTIRQDNAVLSIGERTNANGSKRFRELLAAGDVDGMVQMAREQLRHGSHLLDVCTAYVGRDEAADMEKVIRRFTTDVPAPLMIDSTEPPVMETALKLAGGRCIINSVNLEDGEGRFDIICGLARRYGAALVALTIDEEGMAKTADKKLAVAKRIYDLAVHRHGLRPSDLIFDPLTFTICTGNEDDRRLALETLDALRRIKEELPGAHTLLGLSNVSFGLRPPARKVLNSVFLHYAYETMLDAAILHASGIVPLYKIDEHHRHVAEDLIFDRRRDDYDPLIELVNLFPDDARAKAKEEEAPKSVDQRLKLRIINGDRVGLEDDLNECMTTTRPLDIINDILLDGMKTVGDLFGAGQMQLPFVLQSAETMKAAVAFLEPFMDRADSTERGSIVLATVRGDVHDIGKNLVDIILTNNGYAVHNLGVKQPINTILEAYEKHNAHAIGMSGLLVKSTVVMGENLDVLKERGIRVPIILGGAALTRKYVEEDLRRRYDGPLFYAKDAFDGLDLMNQISSGEAIEPPSARVPAARRVVDAGPVGPTPARSGIARDVPVPTPPFWGSRLVERIDIRAALPYINRKMLFQVQWQYRRGGRPKEEYERFVAAEVEPIFRELVNHCEREEIIECQAIYGYWPCQADGDVLMVYDPNDTSRCVARFDFPRQRKKPYWCLSDFFRPVESREMDVVAFHVVTAGRRVTEVAHEWLARNRYRDYLHLHGLGVEIAEALAEYIHKQIRMELAIADQDAREIERLFQQGYQGSRYSFGYPACPRLEDQVKIWPLLAPDRIGLTLSEEFQIDPEQSTSAIVCHHPEAKYFNVR